jgi:putative nucleotidyltransferase with HDIG domain
MRPLRPFQVLLFGVTLAVVLVLALFPFFLREFHVREGDIASRDIRSPREQRFDSQVLTELAREDAAQAVPDVLVFDAGVRPKQLATAAAATASVASVRENDALDETEKRAALLGIPGLSDLSRGSIDTALGLSGERWQLLETSAEEVLDRVLSRSIALEGLQAEQDNLAREFGPEVTGEEADFVADLLRPLVIPTLDVDEEATEQQRDAARQNVEPVQQSIAENQVIVREGDPIDATAVEILEQVGLLTPRLEWDRLMSAAVMALLAAAILALYVWLFPAGPLASERRLVLLAFIIAVPVLLARMYFSLVLPDEARWYLAYFLPVAAAPMLIATLLEARLAIVIGMMQAALMTFAVVYLPDLSLVATIEPLDAGRVLLVYGLSAVVGVLAVQRAERLNQYVVGGVLVAGAALAALIAVWLLEPVRALWPDLGWMALAALVAGVGSGLLTAGGFAAVGALLGVTTRVQLMELSQLNAPLLRRLQDEASGTFHHSIIVGNLAERAADLVGADALLVRVGCYYHDIGKVLQPGFYIENQLAGDNPHEGMDPEDSARIIAQHVEDGVDMARRHGLPPAVRAFIPEHHGTRLIPYFYRVASQQEEEVDRSLFRYPGPKPQSRETAIVMLADSIEATVRSSVDRSPDRIDALVEEMVAERLAEGELEECDLTLRDIRTIAESFKQTLRAVYHPRIAYPEPTEGERRALMGRFRPGRRAARPLPEAPAPSSGRRPT